jgi:glucosamine--fructose-6-phosphate aminotransferase (isomerizing)
MCGIIGYLGSNSFQEYVLSGLKLLQNRGYDSMGVSIIADKSLKTTKFASTNTYDSFQILSDQIQEDAAADVSTIAIGHTRWATHGGKTDANAHPHHDCKNRISIVHNGIIENYMELKMELLNLGYIGKSQTDTEIISMMIGRYLDEGVTMTDALQKTVDRLRGTWALIVIHRDFPEKMWLTRNGSPLLLGMSDDMIIVTSEMIAFLNYVKTYIVLNNHDIVEVTKGNGGISYSPNVQRYQMKEKAEMSIELSPTNYPYWMLKEIFEQPDAVRRAINYGGRIQSESEVKLGGLDACKHRLLTVKHLILLGCGTSFHAGLWSMEIFKSLELFETVTIFDGAEFTTKDIPKSGQTACIMLSQSGETKDLHRCVHIAQERGLITIGVVNVHDSLIARESDCGVYLNAGREVGVASTKSFTNQCVVLALIAVWFSQVHGTFLEKRRKIIRDLHSLPFHIQLILDNSEKAHSITHHLLGANSAFLLGKGKEEAIAKEGALKIKEIAYIHAEGYSSSALKHGPFALITEYMPIFILDIGEEHHDKNMNAYHETSARGANVILISDQIDCELKVENNGVFGGILANVYLQMISYYLAIDLAYNPDFPRNLAKVVTVE